MGYDRRPVPLTDEIKLHVTLWMYDNDWKSLSVPLKESLTRVLNEIKVRDAVKANGGDENMDEESPAAKKRRYIAIFKQKYVEYSDMTYNLTIDSGVMYLVGDTVKRLEEEGAMSLDYLNWFFDEFMCEERNKKMFAPPTINVSCSKNIVNKFLFANKDLLRVRKESVKQLKEKNALMELARRYLERHQDKEFGQKALDFSKGSLTVKKFLSLFLAICEKENDTEILDLLKQLVGEKPVE